MARLPSPPPNRQPATTDTTGATVPSTSAAGASRASASTRASANASASASGSSGRSPSLPPFSPPSSGNSSRFPSGTFAGMTLGDRPSAAAIPPQQSIPAFPPTPPTMTAGSTATGTATIHAYRPPSQDPAPATEPVAPLRVSTGDRQLAGFLRQRTRQPRLRSPQPQRPPQRGSRRPVPPSPQSGDHPVTRASAPPAGRHTPQPPRPLRRSASAAVPKPPRRSLSLQQRSRRLWAILLLAWALLWLMGGVAAVHLLRATTRPSEAMWESPTVPNGANSHGNSNSNSNGNPNAVTGGDRRDANRIPLNQVPSDEEVPGLNPTPSTSRNTSRNESPSETTPSRSQGPSLGLLLMIFMTCGAIGWVRLQQLQRSAGQRQRRQRLQGRPGQRPGQRPSMAQRPISENSI